MITAAAAGAVLGDNLGYLLGRILGARVRRHYGRYLHLSERTLIVGPYLFHRHGGKAVFFGRFVAVLRIFAPILAGTNHMPWRRFVLCNAAGGVLWATLMGLLGCKPIWRRRTSWERWWGLVWRCMRPVAARLRSADGYACSRVQAHGVTRPSGLVHGAPGTIWSRRFDPPRGDASYGSCRPWTGHGVTGTGPCPARIIAAFLDHPSTKPDTSCIAGMWRYQFMGTGSSGS